MGRWLTSTLLNACVVFGLTLGMGVVAWVGLFFSQFEPTSTLLQNQVVAFGLLAASGSFGSIMWRLQKQLKAIAPEPDRHSFLAWVRLAVLFGMYSFSIIFAFVTVFQALSPETAAVVPASAIAETSLLMVWLVLARVHERLVANKLPFDG